MKVAVCYNLAAPIPIRGERRDHISEAGAETEARSVAQGLQQLGHEPELVPLGEEIYSFVAQLKALKPAVVFNLCEGFRGNSANEMHVAALYELLGIPYTGSSSLCLALTQNKILTKDILVRHGLPTPDYFSVGTDEVLPPHSLTYPLIVKPSCEDASLSIGPDSIVYNDTALTKRIRYIHDRYCQDALIERFIGGREFNAAVLGNPPAAALPVSEIVFTKDIKVPIVSYAGKWETTSTDYRETTPVCPAEIEEGIRSKIAEIAVKACRLLGCRDYARVDIRLEDEVPYILEINANPDIGPDAGFARAARIGGYEYPALIQRLLNMALTREGIRYA